MNKGKDIYVEQLLPKTPYLVKMSKSVGRYPGEKEKKLTGIKKDKTPGPASYAYHQSLTHTSGFKKPSVNIYIGGLGNQGAKQGISQAEKVKIKSNRYLD